MESSCVFRGEVLPLAVRCLADSLRWDMAQQRLRVHDSQRQHPAFLDGKLIHSSLAHLSEQQSSGRAQNSMGTITETLCQHESGSPSLC